MFRRLSIVAALTLSIVFGGSVVDDTNFSPESGSVSVEEDSEEEED